MRGRLGRVREDAGRLDDDFHFEVAPRKRRRVLLAEGADLVSVDPDHALAPAHLAVEAAVGRVVLEEMGIGRGRCEVVDGNHLEVVGMTLEHGLEALAADSAESVDPDAGCHRGSSSWVCPPTRSTVLEPASDGRPAATFAVIGDEPPAFEARR